MGLYAAVSQRDSPDAVRKIADKRILLGSAASVTSLANAHFAATGIYPI